MKLISVKDLDGTFQQNLCVMNDMDADKLLIGNFHLQQLLMRNFIINMFEEIHDVEISNAQEEFGITSILLKVDNEKCLKVVIENINQMTI